MIGVDGSAACPDCGGFTLLPHCNRGNCAGRWCWRADCSWDSPIVCQLDGLPEYPEYVYNRQVLRPVLEPYGVFSKTTLGGIKAIGWQFEENGAPAWIAISLYHLITSTLEGIRALPGPSVW